jgi:hypothetical protein
MTKHNKYRTPKYFRIKLEGRLEDSWSDWFEKMAVSFNGSETVLTGPIADQAALHGLLNRIRDLNVSLLSVERLDPLQDKEK